MWSSCWWFELLIIEPQLNGSLCGQSAEAVSRVPRQGFHFQMSTAIRCRGRWLVYVQNLHLLSHDSFICQQWTTIGAHLLLLYVLATTDHRFRNWHLKPLHWWWHNSHSTLCWVVTSFLESTMSQAHQTSSPAPTDLLDVQLIHTSNQISPWHQERISIHPTINYLTYTIWNVYGAQSGVGCQKLL